MPRILFCTLFLVATSALADDAPAKTDGPLPPAEAMKRFVVPEDLVIEQVLAESVVRQPVFLNFDERGRMWVVQYLQYPEPAGLKIVSRDKFWRAVYDKVPLPPPQGEKGADKITIHEDTDGDGTFDSHKTFVEGLNIATACVKGRGGVWVLNPPYLLFYPDANDDDVPDGDPIVHLEGFGMEDTHSVVNSLCWGPDGWLYGAQGSTVSAHVRRPGEKPAVDSMGQLIWRYHPETRRYEIFSEGGGNAFGVEIDSKGRIFSGHNGGDTRGFHYQQGAYLQKGFSKHGPLSNPFAFGYFPAMKHHNVPRFTHNFVVYEGDALPEKYHGKLFGVAPLLNHVVFSEIVPEGSTFKTKDLGHAVTTTDPYFRPVDVKVGPDGALYVADWYDKQTNHFRNHEGQIDKGNGRIYRISAKFKREVIKKQAKQDSLGPKKSAELVALLDYPNKWQRRMALRILGDRKDKSVVAELKKRALEGAGQGALEALWGLNLCLGQAGKSEAGTARQEPPPPGSVASLGTGRTCWLDDETVLKLLDHADPYVRVWTVRLACDDLRVSEAVARKMAQLALSESHVEIRSQLASSAKRLGAEQSLPIVRNLMTREEDADDLRVPLLVWWAIEAKCDSDREAVLKLFEESPVWRMRVVSQHLLSRLMQRFASTGKRQDLLVCARLLKLSPGKEATTQLMRGFEEAFKGRSLSNLPEELANALQTAGGVSEILAVRQGNTDAVTKALAAIADAKADPRTRLQFVQLFGEVRQPKCMPVLLDLIKTTNDDGLRIAALTSLQNYDDESIGETVLGNVSKFGEDARTAAMLLLASRKSWALSLLSTVDSGKVDAAQVPEDAARRMSVYRDEPIARLVKKHFAGVRGTATAEMQQLIERLTGAINAKAGDPYAGKKLFTETCAKCHRLHGQGGEIGPDLTTLKRDDVPNLLLHIVNPSAEIREGFETLTVLMLDGRVVTGFLLDKDVQTLVLRGSDGQNVSLKIEAIDEQIPTRQSLMPEGLLSKLSDQQARDLFGYLRSAQPLNE